MYGVQFLLLALAARALAVQAAPDAGGLAATTPTPDDPDDPAYEYDFPAGFFFSSASASYQVEGGWNASGKGENIWDHASHVHPEYTRDGSNGDIACDSYNKYKEDIGLIKELGGNMYRFSLSWSRLLPTGMIDVVNDDGIRYYNAIIDECIANKIEPMVTIFHWDLPQPLQDLGGIPNEVFVDYFVDYANFAFKTFGPKVTYWATFNEPLTMCADGYGTGDKAPKILRPGIADYLCAHNTLKAHGKAYHLYQDQYKATQNGKIGIALNNDCYWPKNESNADDVAAAERWQQFNLGWYAHPIFSEEGDYPAVLREYVDKASKEQGLARSRLPTFTAAEIANIKGTADFFGLNAYTSVLVAQLTAADGVPSAARYRDAQITTSYDPSWETSVATWHHVVPKGMRKLLNWVKKQYNNIPLIITENGYPDRGELKDVKRTRYYRLYLLEMLKAIVEDGCNIFGYTAWSLMDNYEWFQGFTERYGIYHVDFTDPDRPRKAKMSALFYQKLIATGRVPKDGDIVYPDEETTTAAPTTKKSNSASASGAVALLVAVLPGILVRGL